MPKKDDNIHVETTPHFDGERDRVIKDSIGTKMGVRIDREEKYPYDVSELENEEMKDFEKMMRGKDPTSKRK